jgi:hypothetical protein
MNSTTIREMERKQQQAELILMVGDVLRPLRDVCEQSNSSNEGVRRTVRAQLTTDLGQLRRAVRRYCKDGTADYSNEYEDFDRALSRLEQIVKVHLVEKPDLVLLDLNNVRSQLVSKIIDIPSHSAGGIFEARTPFTTYLRLRTLFATASPRAVVVDRYIAPELFVRYFCVLEPSTQLTVVTWPKASHRGKNAYDSFVDIARMYKAERPDFRLLTHPDIHDRWLQFGTDLYHAGGSSKDAAEASYYTLSRIESSADRERVEQLIAEGTVVI